MKYQFTLLNDLSTQMEWPDQLDGFCREFFQSHSVQQFKTGSRDLNHLSTTSIPIIPHFYFGIPHLFPLVCLRTDCSLILAPFGLVLASFQPLLASFQPRSASFQPLQARVRAPTCSKEVGLSCVFPVAFLIDSVIIGTHEGLEPTNLCCEVSRWTITSRQY